MPDAGAQSFGDRLQQLVADTVAQRVVDGLEAVEIQEQNADVTLSAMSAVNGLVEALDQQGPVGQPGQWIVSGQMVDALGGDLALRFPVEQIQREGQLSGQIGQQTGDVGVEEIALGRISAQAADRLAVAPQRKSGPRPNAQCLGCPPPCGRLGILLEIVIDLWSPLPQRPPGRTPVCRRLGSLEMGESVR